MKVKVIKNQPRTQTKYVTELLWFIIRINTMRMAKNVILGCDHLWRRVFNGIFNDSLLAAQLEKFPSVLVKFLLI